MKIECKNCLPKEGIEIPDFDQSERHILMQLTIQSPINSTKYLFNNYNLTHRDAKYIATHINKVHGHCNRCDFTKLAGEYINCPKFEALNFNWENI